MGIGSAIGAGVKGLTSIIGGIVQGRAMRGIKKSLKSDLAENQAWFDKNYNEDATQRADAVRILEQTRQQIDNRNKQAAATAAVMGGTEESVAASKAANAGAMSDAAAQIAIAGQQRKDSIDQQYRARKQELNAQLRELKKQKASAIGDALAGVGDAAASIGGMDAWNKQT